MSSGTSAGVASRLRVARRRAFLAAATIGLGVAGQACSTPENLAGEGQACLLFTDCDPHFVCYKNVCTKDLDALVSMELVDATAYADTMNGDGAPGYPEGSTPYPEGGEGSYMVAETSLPEASPQPETGPPVDATMTTPEASAPPEPAAETSTLPSEAGE